MLVELVYPLIKGFIAFLVMIVVILMILRLVFNYSDPNPFSKIGRLSYKVKKITDRFVYPIAGFLARMKVDTRIAPLIGILISCVIGYFILQLFFNLFFTFDGIVEGFKEASITRIAGFLLYGLLGIYSLMIVIRIILSWVITGSNKFLRLLHRFTDPVLEPFRRIIPPLGMFDISPIVVLFLLNFFQIAVAGVLISS